MRSRLRSGEEFAGVFRRHWIVLGGPFAVALFSLGCLIATFYIARPPYLKAVFGTLLAVTVLWSAWRWLAWRHDLWVVTTNRVIDESGVLNVRTVDSPLDKIHNVTLERSLFGRVFGYGTIDIQTAAERGATLIEMVERPEELKEAILEAQEQFRGRTAASQMEPLIRAAAGAAAGAAGGGGMMGPGGAAAGGAGARPGAEGTTKECPHCAETIKAKATICRYCGRPV